MSESTADRVVRQEVYCCLSHLVSTLAAGYGYVPSQAKRHGLTDAGNDLAALCEQAFELASPVDDYEEAAIQAGWTGPHTHATGGTYYEDKTDGQTWACGSWRELCDAHNIEPYQREVFEHWSVSDWLADKLEAAGEKVSRDFANMNVWARCTTGQGIAADSVIEAIAREIDAR